mmetsp:Transcript_98484/g.155669  ORF Transcript_98484/g.155669 Transcript_98484/m.155669 type:complete len:178 (+) Transcript_98484:64-597(+)
MSVEEEIQASGEITDEAVENQDEGEEGQPELTPEEQETVAWYQDLAQMTAEDLAAYAEKELGYTAEQIAELEANVAYYRGGGEEAWNEEQSYEFYSMLSQMTPEDLEKHLVEELGYSDKQKQEVLQHLAAFQAEDQAAEFRETDEFTSEGVDKEASNQKRPAPDAEEEQAAKIAKEA